MLTRSDLLEAKEDRGVYHKPEDFVNPTFNRVSFDQIAEVALLTVKGYASFARTTGGCQIRNLKDTYRFLNAENLKIIDKSLVIEVVGDSMFPTILEGAKVLTEEVNHDNWEHAGGVVAVVYAGQLVIKRIASNRLKTNGTMLLTSDNPRGGEVEIIRDDIQCMWKVLCTVFQKIS